MLTVTVAMLVTTSGAASALPPSNDDINNATAITELPMFDVVDLSLATWDYTVDSSQCGGQYSSVWYSFTPADDGRIIFDPRETNDGVAIDVFTGTPDALSFVGCIHSAPWGPVAYILNATAGTTYWIMGSYAGRYVEVPTLNLQVYLAQPPQATFTVQAGTADRVGNVTITGTIDCVGVAPSGVSIHGDVRQNVGRLNSITATFNTTAPCSGHQTWSALAQPETGRFSGGPANVNANAQVCNGVGCANVSITKVLTLHG